MKHYFFKIFILILSVIYYGEAVAKNNVLVERYDKVFELHAPKNFCFLSLKSPNLHKQFYNLSNKIQKKIVNNAASPEHVEFLLKCDEVNAWLNGKTLNSSIRIHFAVETLQNKKIQSNLIKTPNAKKFVKDTWDILQNVPKILYESQKEAIKLLNKDADFFKIYRIGKNDRCVISLQNMIFENKNKLSGISASCIINERSIMVYLYKDNDFFKNEEELVYYKNLINNFTNSIK